MNKKIYSSLFFAGVLFASCSNEFEQFAQQGAVQEGFKVDLTLTNDATRASWNEGTAPTWDPIDKFSVYNVTTAGNYATAFTASANAAYVTNNNGKDFTSENVLFVGKHALVYPLDENYVQPNQFVRVSVGNNGDAGLGANTVVLGTKLINVTTAGETVDGVTVNQAGFHKKMSVPVRAASAGFVFNLVAENALQLTSTDPKVEINKVELIAQNTPFASIANLHALDAEGATRIVTKAVDLTNKVDVEYEGLEFVNEGTKVYIAALPYESNSAAAGDYKIVVTTNYGIVTIDKAVMVSRVKDGKTLIQLAVPAEKTDGNKNDNLSFQDEMTQLATRATEGTAMPRIARDVKVDMTTADINGLEIKSSAQLLAAYRAYDLMGKDKDDNIKFTLTPDADGIFTLTKAAVEAINRHKSGSNTAATLITNASGKVVKKIILTEYEANVENLVPAIDQIADVDVEFAAGYTWKFNVNNAKAINANFKEITNKGTLVLDQTATADGQVVLAKNIKNDGTITFNASETTIPTYVLNNGTIEVAEGKTVKVYAADFANESTTNVKGELISLGTINNCYGSTVNVWGNLLNTTSKTLANAGTINVKDANAQVILSNNEIGVNKGSINLTANDNNVNAGVKKGYVKLAVDAEEYVMNTENLGVANYIEFSGSKLNMDIQNWGTYVEFKSNAKITAEDAKVGLFVVNKNVSVTIADGAKITTTAIFNEGKIYNYGSFTYTNPANKGTIYDF